MKSMRRTTSVSRAPFVRLAPTRRAGSRCLHVPSRAQALNKPPFPLHRTPSIPFPRGIRTYSSPAGSSADALMENLTELYSTAKDEFEIAAEETEKKTTYGPEDREAAHEAFQVLKEAYRKAVAESGDEAVGREVERRVGPRIRELESALANMDEMALED